MKRGVVILVVVAVAVVAGALFFVFVGSFSPSTPAAERTTAPVSTPPFTARDATRLGEDMTSGDEQRVRAVLAVPGDQALDPAAVADLAAVGPVQFDHSTFRDVGGGRAEVLATTATGSWVVGLVAVEEEWRIESTRAAT